VLTSLAAVGANVSPQQARHVAQCELEKSPVLPVRTPGGAYQTTWAFELAGGDCNYIAAATKPAHRHRNCTRYLDIRGAQLAELAR